jgi:ribosomal protein S8
MVSTDPISDMFTRIRNAIAVNKRELSLPYSGIKETVAKILADCFYLVRCYDWSRSQNQTSWRRINRTGLLGI